MSERYYYTIEQNKVDKLYMYLTYFDELTYDPSKAYQFNTEEETKKFMKENNISEKDFHIQRMYTES